MKCDVCNDLVDTIDGLGANKLSSAAAAECVERIRAHDASLSCCDRLRHAIDRRLGHLRQRGHDGTAVWGYLRDCVAVLDEKYTAANAVVDRQLVEAHVTLR